MCEQLLSLPVLLAVTFKCQDSSCPIRKDQSSHVEKSQYWLQFLTGWQRTSLLMPAFQTRPSPPGDSHRTALSGHSGDKDPAQPQAGVYKGWKHWPWEPCHEPSVENKTRHLNQSPHTSAYVQRQEMGKVNVTSEMLTIFLFRFLTVLPTLFWSGSVLLAATSIIMSWNTSKAHISVLLPHRQDAFHQLCWTDWWVLHPCQLTAEQGKETQWRLQSCYSVPTKSTENLIKFKCNTKSIFYCKHLTLFS